MFETPFEAVDLHIFDVHTTVRPLVFNNCLQEGFRFLAEPDAYRAQYAGGKTILTKSFDIHTLSKHSQTQNHLWKNYLNRFEDSTIDYWKLQAPFICSLRQPTVSLDENLGFQGRISPLVYLSALGWSSNLNIHLRGNIQISALLDFILGIIGKDDPTSTGTGTGLKLNGHSAKLAGVFSALAKQLLQEVYDPANPPTTRGPELPRHIIVSLSKFKGPPLAYQRTISTRGMTNADQALLHSLVRGERIMPRELGKKLRETTPTMVSFGPGPDFMLIYFDYGTLVFMQNSARQNDLRQRRLSCVAANIRSYAMMIWSMYYFSLATKDASNKAVIDLRDLVRANLMSMKHSYLSTAENMRGSVRYAKALFQNHDGLSKLLPEPT